MPFTSAAERGRWASAHTAATGHDRWQVLDQPAEDGPEEFAEAFTVRRPAPTAAEVTKMVDETAKAEMRRQGRDPAVWDRLPNDVRDELRLLALDRLRSLA